MTGLTALAAAVRSANSTLSSPLPGVKPGPAKMVTILALTQYGCATAAWAALRRMPVGSLLIGAFLPPAFVLKLCGAVASIAIWGIPVSAPGRGFGPVGYSLLAALANMAAQFFTASWAFIPHAGLFHLLPILMTAALIFGIISGMITQVALQRMRLAEMSIP
jgi:heptaprenyl diphosphate synthase